MLIRADKILRTGSVEDIREFLPDLLLEYTKLDSQATELNKLYELARIERYVELKKAKKNKENTYTDKDIDYLSKHYALKKYGDYELNRKVANHYKMYIEELRNQVINLNVINKALREAI